LNQEFLVTTIFPFNVSAIVYHKTCYKLLMCYGVYRRCLYKAAIAAKHYFSLGKNSEGLNCLPKPIYRGCGGGDFLNIHRQLTPVLHVSTKIPDYCTLFISR